jgi:hypothetical protein
MPIDSRTSPVLHPDSQLPQGRPKVEVVPPFPSLLYRYFGEERWAREFVERGRFHFSHLEYYRQFDCAARGDDTEGEGFASYYDDVQTVHFGKTTNVVKGVSVGSGKMDIHSNSCNAYFIMCCTRPPDDDLQRLASEFGSYVVKISDPERLAEDIAVYLRSLSSPPFSLECVQVTYGKGGLLAGKPDSETLKRLSWADKPPAYAYQHEWRYVLTDEPKGTENSDTDELEGFDLHINIEIGRPLDYAELITVQI